MKHNTNCQSHPMNLPYDGETPCTCPTSALQDGVAMVAPDGAECKGTCSEEEWEKEVREMFVVGNMRFGGLANDKLTPDNLISFIAKHTSLAYEQGRQSILNEMQHEQRKFLDGFAHPKDCEMCINPTTK